MNRIIFALVAVAALAFPAMAKQHGMHQELVIRQNAGPGRSDNVSRQARWHARTFGQNR